MDRNAELSLFLEKADELLESKYIIADVKILGLLKAVAASETLVAIFKNCLSGFDYTLAKEKYLTKSKYLSGEKGEFIQPSSSRELLAFVFCILCDIDSKKIDFSQFINKYFYLDGSFSAGYSEFLSSMIKPFCNSVKKLMEGVINGTIQDPEDAFTEEEQRRAEKEKEEELAIRREKELSQKSYGDSVKAIKEILLNDKTKIKSSKVSEDEKEELVLLIDTFANAVESGDKDALVYSYTAYKYATKAKKLLFFNSLKKVNAKLGDVINGL